MTDAEISRRLALAIGWKAEDFMCSDPVVIKDENGWWRRFDYRDTAVIWPIAERFNCFPVAGTPGVWVAYFDRTNTYAEAATAAKAVALAIIKAHEGANE